MIKRKFKQSLFPVDMEICFCEIKDLRKKWRDGIIEDEMENSIAVTSYYSNACYLQLNIWFNTKKKDEIDETAIVHECIHAMMDYVHVAKIDTGKSSEVAPMAMEWIYSCAMKTYREFLKSINGTVEQIYPKNIDKFIQDNK